MKKRDKATLMKVIFGAIVVLAVGIIWAANYTLPVDESLVVTSAQWVQDLHGFFLDIYTAISTDYNVLILIAASIIGGYYFLVYKPRLRR